MVSKFKKIIGCSMILGISVLAAGCLRQKPVQQPQPQVQQPVEQNPQGQLPSNDDGNGQNMVNKNPAQVNTNGSADVDATLNNLDKLSDTSDTQDVDDSDIDNF